jgi:hypothetical protein
MPTLRLNTESRVSTLGKWVAQIDGSYRCGNVLVRNVGGQGVTQCWRIFILDGENWKEHMPASRSHGYFCAGSAKIGAALMASHQRRKGILHAGGSGSRNDSAGGT